LGVGVIRHAVMKGGGGCVVEVGDKSRVKGTAPIMEARALRDGGCFRA
jgi:hypothetical protein